MLSKEIEKTKRLVRTDAYHMSIGELVSMYASREIIIDPEFQRLFRWKNEQKTKLIESLLLGIPVPSIFVFEKEDGTWELIDGLQRISTILEFMGRLRRPEKEGEFYPPSILEGTGYLPSLDNIVWEKSDKIRDVKVKDQTPLENPQQLAVRRARLGVEILKRPSDDQTKYELFQRLNSGGTQANAQELRNCIMLMINGDYFREVKSAAEEQSFRNVISATPHRIETQWPMEMAVRFLVHTNIPYEGRIDVEEYINRGIEELAKRENHVSAVQQIRRTFQLLEAVAGQDTLRRYQRDRGGYVGTVGHTALEVIAVGVAKNFAAIEKLGPDEAKSFVEKKIHEFWSRPDIEKFIASGLRGTDRIQRTVPCGKDWFRP